MLTTGQIVFAVGLAGLAASLIAFEQREEALKLRAKLEAAEQGRLAGAPAYTLEDSRKRLEEIYRRG